MKSRFRRSSFGRCIASVALAATSLACATKVPTRSTAGPARLDKSGGDVQTGTVSQTLAVPLQVLATDAAAGAVPGVTVTWAVTAGGGNLSAGSGSTDASGHSAVNWTLGATAGANTATAAVPGLPPVTFTATGVAGQAAKLAFTAQPFNVTAGTAISPAVQVAVRDAYDNPVTTAGNTIAVAIAAGTGGAGAGLSGTKSKAATAGVASYADLSVDKAATGYKLTATASGLASATSSAFSVTAGAAASVAKQAGDGQTVAAGSAAPVPPSVVVKDAFGNTKSGATVTFAVASGGGSVSGATQTSDANGVATVGAWTLGGAAGTNTLTATVSGSGIAGNPVTFTATATAATAPTLLFQESFDNTSVGARGWYDLPGGGIASIDSTQHISGSAASLLLNFAQGGVTPSPAAAARHLFTPSDAVYVRYWIKHSANWVGSGKTYHPHLFSFLTNADGAYVGPAYTHLAVYVEENYQNGDVAVLAAQDAADIDTTKINQDLTSVTENRAVAGCNGISDGTVDISCYASGGLWYNGKTWKSAQAVLLPTAGPAYQGDWHEVEVYYKLNSIVNGIGQLDGIAQYWVDGQLVIDRRNVLFRTGAHPTMQFNQFFMGPYIGDGSPVAQQVWVDDLVVMTGRP